LKREERGIGMRGRGGQGLGQLKERQKDETVKGV